MVFPAFRSAQCGLRIVALPHLLAHPRLFPPAPRSAAAAGRQVLLGRPFAVGEEVFDCRARGAVTPPPARSRLGWRRAASRALEESMADRYFETLHGADRYFQALNGKGPT